MAGTLAVVVLGVLAGMLVGCVGIGGVIIVPALAYAAGIPFQIAIPAASAAYIVSGVIGTVSYARAGHVPWEAARPLFIAAMPAAVAGAVASAWAPASLLEIVIGVLAAVSGLQALLADAVPRVSMFEMRSGLLAGLGVVTGFGSALTGTGGPLILVPLLIWLEAPVLIAIGMAQVIQLPIALLATATNAWAEAIDPVLAFGLAAGLAGGTWSGARMAHALPTRTLKRFVAVILVLTGAAMLVKVALRLLA